ncbi:PREDICTED: deoxyribonuclease gamma-like [Thamnophis sirtalis]|uniref:Deoxyribonuclease gamma-like n=1 Tax=Thamnophis sirtalis TaxID=35019 RepID=A0A6I9Z536_9SAUR|nr:PREDICTED: deoxyribonuclease gamma-like [Thamnophis sirtalis]
MCGLQNSRDALVSISSHENGHNNNKGIFFSDFQILSRCAISAVQEVRDSKGLAIQALLQKLNRYYRLSRNMASLISSFPVPHMAVASDFVLLLHHTCPREAARELDLLFEVCMELMHWWKTENVMVLGDLNAGGAYVPMSALARIRLHNHPAFHWLISDEEDTTVSHRTCCSYDRIIVHGEELLSAVVPGSAKPYNFTKAFGLSEEEALEISDHYPVEVKLKLAPKNQQEL